MRIIIDFSDSADAAQMMIVERRYLLAGFVVLLLFFASTIYWSARAVAWYWVESENPLVADLVTDGLHSVHEDRRRLWMEGIGRLQSDIAGINERMITLRQNGEVLAAHLGLQETDMFAGATAAEYRAVCQADDAEQRTPEENAAEVTSLLHTQSEALNLLDKKYSVLLRHGVRANALARTLPVKRPVGGHNWLVSGYGYRKDPFTGRRAFHSGWDYAARTGTPIFAAAAGIVIYSGRLGNYGNAVHIYHGDDVSTLYAHMSEIDIALWQFVEQGDIIGAVGSTGRSTGPHLHYEVRVNNRARPVGKTIRELREVRNLPPEAAEEA